MSTVLDIVTEALNLIGVLADGEVPSGVMGQNGLNRLNGILRLWSLRGTMLYSSSDQSLSWGSGDGVKTVGPTGDIVGVRPNKIKKLYYVLNAISYPIEPISLGDYTDIPDKTTQELPVFGYVNNTFPNCEIKLYPVPNQTLEFHVVSEVELVEFASLQEDVSLPKGYRDGLMFNLAVLSAAASNVPLSDDIRSMAYSIRQAIEKVNYQPGLLNVVFSGR